MSEAPPAKRRRKAIKDSQRKALRDWYNDGSNGKQSLQSCSQWWKAKYGYVLSTSSCSDTLSSKYSHLDAGPVLAWKDKARDTPHDWPVLEEALFEWEQRYEAGHNTLTGEILRLKAIQFWRQLPKC